MTPFAPHVFGPAGRQLFGVHHAPDGLQVMGCDRGGIVEQQAAMERLLGVRELVGSRDAKGLRQGTESIVALQKASQLPVDLLGGVDTVGVRHALDAEENLKAMSGLDEGMGLQRKRQQVSLQVLVFVASFVNM